MLGLVSNKSPKKHLLGIVNKQINLDHPAAYFLFTRQSIPSVPQGPFYFGKRNWKVRKLMIYFWEVVFICGGTRSLFVWLLSKGLALPSDPTCAKQ